MGEPSIQLQNLIVRVQQGDEAAEPALIRCTCERLRRLAPFILNESSFSATRPILSASDPSCR